MAVSNQFLGWLCGLGNKVKIISPSPVVEDFKKYLDKMRGMYVKIKRWSKMTIALFLENILDYIFYSINQVLNLFFCWFNFFVVTTKVTNISQILYFSPVDNIINTVFFKLVIEIRNCRVFLGNSYSVLRSNI